MRSSPMKLLACIALLASTAPAMAGKADDTLNAAFVEEISTLDNYKETTRAGLVAARLIYDNLLYKDHKTGNLVPSLAESYTVVSDTVVDFKLRQGVKFHDGQEMTADDVAYTLNLVSSKEYGARYQIAVSWIDSVEKTGPYSIRLKMKTPYPLALEMLAGNLPIYPKHYYEKVGSAGMGVKPIGTGPYRIAEVIPGSRYSFERFDEYYAGSPKGKPAIKKVVLRILPEANVQYAELMNGQLDWLWRLPPDAAKRLGSRPNIDVKGAAIMRIAYLALNPHFDGGKSPLADVRVRRAFNHAIDKASIIKALVGGASLPIAYPCHPVQFGCESDAGRYEYSPEKAKALLAEAGHSGMSFVLVTTTAIPRAQAEAIAASLSAVGIKVTINEQQPAPARTQWREGKAQSFLGNWGSYGIGDVGLSTSQFFNGVGDDQVKDPDVVAKLKTADTSFDRDLRKKIYSDMQKRIAEQAYWVPLWTYSVNVAQSKDLDLEVQPDEFVPFYKARWK